MTAPTDGQLLAAWRAGDSYALRDLFRRHEARLWRLANLLLRDRWEAEDVAREALWRAYRKLDQLQDGDKFGPWVTTIVRRICADLPDKPTPTPLPDDKSSTNSDVDGRIDIEDALSRIPREPAKLLYEVYVQDWKIEDLAVEYGVTPGALRKRLRRARIELGREMGHLDRPPPRGAGQDAERAEEDDEHDDG